VINHAAGITAKATSKIFGREVCAMVDLGSVIDIEDVHGARVFFDAVDDPVGCRPGSVTAGQGPEKWSAYTVRVDRQCGIAELRDRNRHLLRETLGDRAAPGIGSHTARQVRASPAGGTAPSQILANTGQISTGLAPAQSRRTL
jgi:hypothetical protein